MYIFHLRMNIFLFFKNKVSSRVGDQPPALHADHLRRGDPADPAVHSDSRGCHRGGSEAAAYWSRA